MVSWSTIYVITCIGSTCRATIMISKHIKDIVPDYELKKVYCCWTCRHFWAGYFSGDSTCTHPEVEKHHWAVYTDGLGFCKWYEENFLAEEKE